MVRRYHRSNILTALDLLHAIVSSTPDLPGAACARPENRALFDATTGKAAGRPGTYAKAIQVCASCPALLQCRSWIAGLPPLKHPVGVTAGVIRRSRS